MCSRNACLCILLAPALESKYAQCLVPTYQSAHLPKCSDESSELQTRIHFEAIVIREFENWVLSIFKFL
jgi:hypothetical protein